MLRPKIAAVICVFNKQDYVRRSISSVLTQNPPVDELVIVDDASTDESIARIEAFRDPRIRIIRRTDPARRGVSEAANIAVQSTDAEWIAFLDADDAWLDNYMQTTMEMIEQASPEVVCVFTGWEDRWPDGSATQDLFSSRKAKAEVTRLDFDAFVEVWLSMGFTPLCGSASAFRRDALVRAGLFPVGQHRGEDKDLWLRLMALGEAVGSPEVCAYYDRAVPGQAHKVVSFRQRPCVCTTLEKMIPVTSGERHTQLKRLFNEEIFRYARHVNLQQPIPRDLYRGFYVEQHLLKYVVLLCLTYTPPTLQRLLRQALLAVRRPGAQAPAHAQG